MTNALDDQRLGILNMENPTSWNQYGKQYERVKSHVEEEKWEHY